MEPSDILNDCKKKISLQLDRFRDSLKTLRTGRANASILDGVSVEVYGTSLPIIQVATITAPEAQLLQITPFDPNTIEAISSSIRNNQTLGLNPSDDGRVIRIPIPPLSEERRRELAKQVGSKQEECMISLRSIRHEAINSIDEAKASKKIGEDEAKRFRDQIEQQMSQARGTVDSLAKTKESEIMTV